jgi:hypothetical protein
MKKLYLSIILAAAMIGQAHARIGFTLDECRKAYGKEVSSEAAWCSSDQKACGFISDGLYIYAILSAEGKVVDITYFNNGAKTELSPQLKTGLWELNVDRARVWDDTYYQTIVLNSGWSGKHVYKKLGQESGLHYVMYEANGLNALVENANKLGWQIRTMDQFKLEQRAIKLLAMRDKQRTRSKAGGRSEETAALSPSTLTEE